MSIMPSEHLYDAVIVGAGAAGIGVAIALQHAGIKNFVVLERTEIGASFKAWPAETRFISPSFATNAIGMLDLNAVAIDTSPAFTLAVEHPTGKEYADYLKIIAQFFKVPIREHTDVLRILQSDTQGNDRGNDRGNNQGDTRKGTWRNTWHNLGRNLGQNLGRGVQRDKAFVLETSHETIRARHVIWAAGDFQYPRLDGFTGSTLCQHTATIPSYAALEGDDFIVIGGYESGVDVAYHLAQQGKRVRIFDKDNPWDPRSSDPSVSLSTYSLERIYSKAFEDYVDIFPDTAIASVTASHDTYNVVTKDGDSFQTPVPPLLAAGFKGSHSLIKDMFAIREDGCPLLTEHDESTLVSGLFLCGAAVRHDNHIFCFIYKYRQRFAVVAKAIATSLGLPAKALEEYRQWGMYLDDLSCCGKECAC